MFEASEFRTLGQCSNLAQSDRDRVRKEMKRKHSDYMRRHISACVNFCWCLVMECVVTVIMNYEVGHVCLQNVYVADPAIVVIGQRFEFIH